MKANRKFKDGEEAVSAVIGVILMVAITVAIAATVYVYVSGMLTPTTTGKVMSATLSTNIDGAVTYKIVSADAGITWTGVTGTYTNATGAQTDITTELNYGTTDTEATVGHIFKITFAASGTYTIDLIFNGKIIWSSPSVAVTV